MPQMQNIVNGWTYTFTANNTTSILVVPPSSVPSVFMTFYNVTISGGSNPPVIQVSTNGGTSFITSGYQSAISFSAPYTSTGLANQNTTSGFMWSYYPLIQNTAGSVYIYGLNASSPVVTTGMSTTPNGTTSFGFLGGTLNATTNVNAFQLVCTGQPIASGTFRFYALN